MPNRDLISVWYFFKNRKTNHEYLDIYVLINYLRKYEEEITEIDLFPWTDWLFFQITSLLQNEAQLFSYKTQSLQEKNYISIEKTLCH